MDIKELNIKTKDNQKRHHPWEMARFGVVKDKLKNLINFQNDKKIVVDIGCGDVYFLSQFCKSYPNFVPLAVDTAFSDEIILNLKAEYPQTPIQYYKDVNEISIENDSVSLIFLLDVIEHIEKDIEFLHKIKQLPYVNKQTLFFISVPAFNNLFCNHDKWLGHYRRYSKTMLKNHIKEAGLKEIESGYFFFSLLFPRIVQKMIEKPTQKEDVEGIGNWSGGEFMTKFYKNILIFDYKLSKILAKIGIKLPGLSTYIICRKEN